MKIHELAQAEYSSIDDITVDIAEAVIEVDNLSAENERLKTDLDIKDKEINSLKTKNLELLAMIPTVIEDNREPEEEFEEIEKEEIYF